MLRFENSSDKVAFIIHHSTSDRPVRPLYIRGLDNMHPVRLNILASVRLMNERRRNRSQINIVPEYLVLLARTSVNHIRLDRRGMRHRDHLVEDLLYGRGGLQSEVARETPVALGGVFPQGGGGPEAPEEAVFCAFDVLEQGRFAARLADAAGDGRNLEMRIDLTCDRDKVVVPPQRFDEGAKVQVREILG